MSAHIWGSAGSLWALRCSMAFVFDSVFPACSTAGLKKSPRLACHSCYQTVPDTPIGISTPAIENPHVLDLNPTPSPAILRHFDSEIISWFGLTKARRSNPDHAFPLGQQITSEEFESRHLAASAMSHRDTPYDRARFLAMRNGFGEEWEPKGRERTHPDRYDDPSLSPPRVSQAKAIDHAAGTW